GILWIPIMANISGVLYEYLQSVQSYIAPPITAVFLLGIFYKRINAKGALATLIFGFVVGAIRIVLELVKDSMSPDSFLYIMGDMNFLTFGAYFFLACIVVAVGVSLMTKPASEEQLAGLTFGTLPMSKKLLIRIATIGWI